MLENSTINVSPAQQAAMKADELLPETAQHKIHRLKTRYAPASLLGDHSVCAPPDPISNSAVKPDCANGTNAQALEE
jgi:hypothetical protein